MKKNIFIFDQNKCVGCHACVIACVNENGFQATDQWRNVHKSQEYHFPSLPLFYLSLACNHCDDAPCLKNCPSLAYSRDENTGAVIHHPEKCIGCKYCTWACPYDAPKYNPKSGIIEKCTFCNHRIEENLKPACANLCPIGALDFSKTTFSREESLESSPVSVNVGSNMNTIFLRKDLEPEMNVTLFENQTKNERSSKKYVKISAKEEWPLVVFTLLSTLLVSVFASGITESFSQFNKLIYIACGTIAALLSMFHLGKKTRMWRSVLNPKSSWLSKEIISYALFYGLVFMDLLLFNIPDVIIIFWGFTLLISIDMLYALATWRWPLQIHSAQTIFIGITIYSVLTNSYYLLAFILAFRLTIYIYKTYKNKEKNLILPILRVIIPIISFGFLLQLQHVLFVVLIVTADILDRIEFYNELNVPDPKDEFSIKKGLILKDQPL